MTTSKTRVSVICIHLKGRKYTFNLRFWLKVRPGLYLLGGIIATEEISHPIVNNILRVLKHVDTFSLGQWRPLMDSLSLW